MGLPMERASSAVRFSLGKWTTAEEIANAGKAIERIGRRLNKADSAYAIA
jgi:cysteine sulfinate desulfinase/cysteine desulfurase-like protein